MQGEAERALRCRLDEHREKMRQRRAEDAVSDTTPPAAGEPKKGELRPKQTTPEEGAEAIARSAAFQEFRRLAKLPLEPWEVGRRDLETGEGGMKRLVVFLIVGPILGLCAVLLT
jgi:hypothetical protein